MFNKILPTESVFAVSISYKLLNLLNLKSLSRFTASPWKYSNNQNIRIIQEKATNDLYVTVNRFKSNYEFSFVFSYLDNLIKDKNIYVLSSQKKGTKCDLNLDESIVLFKFMSQISSSTTYVVHGATQQQQFQFHELLSAVINYLLIKDSINNGMGNIHLDNIIKNMVEVKPARFFEMGYLSDIFVSDRLTLKLRKGIKFLRCNSNWLSTDCFETIPVKDDGFDLHKLF